MEDDSGVIKWVLVASLIFNVVLAFGVFTLYIENASYTSKFRLIMEENEALNQKIIELQKAYEVEKKKLDYYRQQAEYYSNVNLSDATVGEALIGGSKVNVVAVRSFRRDPFTVGYEGVVLLAEVELRHGQGRILINTEPKIGIDLQSSLRTAVLVTEEVAQASLNRTDVILTLSYFEDVEIVDGPSAGAAITMGLLAAIRGETMNPDIYVTGTINPDGSIGMVGGTMEKAEAAAINDARAFIVPKGQGTVTNYKEVKSEPIPGFMIVTYEPYQVDLQEYLTEKGYDIKVVEASDIEEAYKLAAV
jgi:uncharacterized protein